MRLAESWLFWVAILFGGTWVERVVFGGTVPPWLPWTTFFLFIAGLAQVWWDNHTEITAAVRRSNRAQYPVLFIILCGAIGFLLFAGGAIAWKHFLGSSLSNSTAEVPVDVSLPQQLVTLEILGVSIQKSPEFTDVLIVATITNIGPPTAVAANDFQLRVTSTFHPDFIGRLRDIPESIPFRSIPSWIPEDHGQPTIMLCGSDALPDKVMAPIQTDGQVTGLLLFRFIDRSRKAMPDHLRIDVPDERFELSYAYGPNKQKYTASYKRTIDALNNSRMSFPGLKRCPKP